MSLATGETPYRVTPLTRKRNPLGSYRRPMPRVLGGSLGGGRQHRGEVPLYCASSPRTTSNQK